MIQDESQEQKKRRTALIKARVTSGSDEKTVVSDTLPAKARLTIARTNDRDTQQLSIRPLRVTPRQSQQERLRAYQSNLSAVRARDAAEQYRQQNRRDVIQRKLDSMPPCRRSIFIFAYTLAATNISLAFMKTIFLSASELAADLIGTTVLLIPFVGFAAKLAIESLGLAIGWVIGGFITVLQFAIGLYLYLFMRARTSFSQRKAWNIGVVALSVMPLVDMVPWVILRLRSIKKAEKKNCRERTVLERKLETLP